MNILVLLLPIQIFATELIPQYGPVSTPMGVATQALRAHGPDAITTARVAVEQDFNTFEDHIGVLRLSHPKVTDFEYYREQWRHLVSALFINGRAMLDATVGMPASPQLQELQRYYLLRAYEFLPRYMEMRVPTWEKTGFLFNEWQHLPVAEGPEELLKYYETLDLMHSNEPDVIHLQKVSMHRFLRSAGLKTLEPGRIEDFDHFTFLVKEGGCERYLAKVFRQN